MPSQTTQGAVSEYERLNARNHLNVHEESLSDGEDFLPLKTQKPSIASFLPPSKSSSNTNNSNIYRGDRQIDEFFSTRNLPLPSAWSPGVPVAPKPSIDLTPLKSTQNDDNVPFRDVLESFDTNKMAVPVPSASGEDVIFRPTFTPSLFITPEKPSVKDNFIRNSTESKENSKDDTNILKSKGKHSVRFDLPSFSSADETNESNFFGSESPIILKGQDVSDKESPQWKAFSPQKSYDPFAYSDESVLDESLPGHENGVFQTDKSVEDSNCDQIATSSHLQSLSTKSQQRSPHRISKRKYLKKNTGANCLTRKSISVSTTSSSGNVIATDKQGKITKVGNNSGPHFLQSQLSQYDQKPPKPCIIRESKNKHEEADYSFPFDAHSGESEFEHAFARPEYNSTLRVRSECDKLAGQEVDVEAALIDTLARSEVKRTEVNEKASMYTNRLSDQFHSLVSLDTSMESLCDRIVRMRTSRIQTKRKPPPQKKSGGDEAAPDLMEFFSPELQRESPDLSLPGVTPVTFDLITAPHNVAFDLYRHNRMWNGINDF